jgi:hypothetical protein
MDIARAMRSAGVGAPADGDPDLLPESALAMTCAQCHGSYVRLEGELVCGDCGWPAKRPLPARPNDIVQGLQHLGESLRDKNDALRAENDRLRADLAAARAKIDTLGHRPEEEPQPEPVPSETHSRRRK